MSSGPLTRVLILSKLLSDCISESDFINIRNLMIGLPFSEANAENLECLVLQPCHLAFLSWDRVHLDSVKLWHMSWVVHHPLWYQRMSVSGPRQLGRSGTRVGKYGLKRLIYCSNIIMRCTVGRKSVEILSRRCWRWLLVWISFMRLACVDYTKSYYSSCQSKAMYMVTAVDVNTVMAW